MSALSLLAFFISLFGFRMIFRTTDNLFERRLIDRRMRSFARVFAPLLIVLTVVFLSKHPLLAWISVCVALFCLVMSQFMIRKQREQRFRTEFLDYLERVILLVRTGKPFRMALTAATDDMSPFTQQKLEKILEYVFFSQHSELRDADIFTRELIRELGVIDRSAHRCMERLTVLRRNLRLEHEFRSRAGQVVRRLRWQSYILTGLYLALMMFVLSNFKWSQVWLHLWISVTFFVTGLAWIQFAGRRIKWKI